MGLALLVFEERVLLPPYRLAPRRMGQSTYKRRNKKEMDTGEAHALLSASMGDVISTNWESGMDLVTCMLSIC